MIPNSAPMAAVYLDDGRLFSRPVAAWGETGNALVVYDLGETRLLRADYEGHPSEFLGLWQHGWNPTHDQMSSLLPDRTPGQPDPLATRVTLEETEAGTWAAYRYEEGSLLTTAGSVDELEKKLSAVGGFHIEKIIPLGDDN